MAGNENNDNINMHLKNTEMFLSKVRNLQRGGIEEDSEKKNLEILSALIYRFEIFLET